MSTEAYKDAYEYPDEDKYIVGREERAPTVTSAVFVTRGAGVDALYHRNFGRLC